MAGDSDRLNALGLLCPMPVIRTQQRVAALTPGTTLEVLATDPGAVPDIQAWCRVHGHDYVDERECRSDGCATAQAHFHIRLRVRG